MGEIKISALEELLTAANSDELIINDISEPLDIDKTKRIKFSNLVKGLIDIQIAESTSEKEYSTTWEDHPGLTTTLTLSRTCTVLMFAVITGYVNTTVAGYSFFVRGVIDGNADADYNKFNGSANPKRNEALPYIWFKTGITSGSKIAKIQCQYATSGVNNYITNGRLIALAFAE